MHKAKALLGLALLCAPLPAFASGANSGQVPDIVMGTGTSLANPHRTGDASTGLYSATSGAVDIAANGTKVAEFLSGGEQITGTLGVSGAVTLSGLSTGTQVSCVGLNSSNQLVLASGACGAGVGGGITSVFGRSTSAITAQSGDYNTSQVTESGNLYFTNARAIAAPITGFSASAGTVSATDTILAALNKVVGNIALLAPSSGASLTGATVNGVTLTTGGSSTAYLNGAGAYTTPASGGAPGGSSGQIQYNNASAFGGLWIGASPNALTYTAFGDSTSAPSTYVPSANPNTYVAALGQYLNVNPQNSARGGDYSCEITEKVFASSLPNTGTAPVYTLAPGVNDSANKGTGAYETVFNNCEQAAASFLSIPVTNKTFPSAASTTGTWVPSTSGYNGSPLVSTTNGSTETFPVTVGSNGYAVCWFRNADGDGGTFGLKVDSGSATNYATATTPAIAATNNGGTHGATAVFFTGLSAGSHNFIFTVTSATNASNSVEPAGCANIPTSSNIHTYVAGVPYEQSDANSAITAQYNTDSQANVTALAGYGLPIKWVNYRAYWNSTTDMYNSLHPNATGILHQAQAYEAVLATDTLPISAIPSVPTIAPATDTNGGSVGYGFQALASELPNAAYYNTGFGFKALGSTQLTNSIDNVAVGAFTLYQASGSNNHDNVAVGYNALSSQTGGATNTAIGSMAMQNAQAANNTAVGYKALYASAAGSATAVGYQALMAQTTGSYNTAVGYNAGTTITTGAKNVVIGNQVASGTLSTGSDNILIGSSDVSQITTPASSTSNFLNIGNTLFGTSVNTGTVSAPLGTIGIGTAAPAATLDVRGPIKTMNYTVATLPTGSTGDIAYVTDATSCTFLGTLTGSGSTFCPVIFNGTAWVGH